MYCIEFNSYSVSDLFFSFLEAWCVLKVRNIVRNILTNIFRDVPRKILRNILRDILRDIIWNILIMIVDSKHFTFIQLHLFRLNMYYLILFYYSLSYSILFVFILFIGILYKFILIFLMFLFINVLSVSTVRYSPNRLWTCPPSKYVTIFLMSFILIYITSIITLQKRRLTFRLFSYFLTFCFVFVLIEFF